LAFTGQIGNPAFFSSVKIGVKKGGEHFNAGVELVPAFFDGSTSATFDDKKGEMAAATSLVGDDGRIANAAAKLLVPVSVSDR
jgi:hypothetical protein